MANESLRQRIIDLNTHCGYKTKDIIDYIERKHGRALSESDILEIVIGDMHGGKSSERTSMGRMDHTSYR